MAENNESGGGGGQGPAAAPKPQDVPDTKQADIDLASDVSFITNAAGETTQHPNMEEAIAEALRRGSIEAVSRKQGAETRPLLYTEWTNDGSTPTLRFDDENAEEIYQRLQQVRVERRQSDREKKTDPSKRATDPESEKEDGKRTAKAVPLDQDGASATSTKNTSPDQGKREETQAEKAQRFLAQQDPRAKRDPELAKAQSYVDVAKKVAAERWPGNERLQRAYLRGATDQVAASLRNGDELGGIAYRDGQVVSLRQDQQARQTQSPQPTPSQGAEKQLIEQRILRRDAPRLKR